MGHTVFPSYPRRLESLNTCRSHYKDSKFLLGYLNTPSAGLAALWFLGFAPGSPLLYQLSQVIFLLYELYITFTHLPFCNLVGSSTAHSGMVINSCICLHEWSDSLPIVSAFIKITSVFLKVFVWRFIFIVGLCKQLICIFFWYCQVVPRLTTSPGTQSGIN